MRIARVVVAIGLALAAASEAGASCRSTCTEELRVCRLRCADLHGHDRRQCRQRCGEQSTCTAPGVRAGMYAWVQNDCRLDAQGMTTFSQKLVTRRGNCDPVTVLQIPPVGPVADPIGFCPLYGRFRAGAGGATVGLFQHLSVLPDGSGVVFELTDDYSLNPLLTPTLPVEEGVYFVRPDGTGLRRLGPPTGVPIFRVVLDPTSPLGFTILQVSGTILGVSPSGRLAAVTGIGPGPDGGAALQIFLIHTASGKRTQLTHLPATQAGISDPLFADERTVFFFDHSTQSIFTVRTDGNGLAPVPSFEALPGARVAPRFAVAGGGAAFVGVVLDGTPKRTYPGADQVLEVFSVEGHRTLQLTNFGYPDTGQIEPSRGGVQFAASADPLHENPDGVCQLFSIGSLGERLRQLTHFPYDGRPKNGCLAALDASCAINGDVQDPRTGVVVIVSSCDPLGRNPDGEQAFAIRPDGTGLRQITSFRGTEHLPDGSVQVELGGPSGYSAPFF